MLLTLNREAYSVHQEPGSQAAGAGGRGGEEASDDERRLLNFFSFLKQWYVRTASQPLTYT